MTRQQAIEQYIQYKSKTLAPKSIQAYKASIEFFDKHCPDNEWPEVIRAEVNTAINKSGSVKTRNLRKAVIDNFLSWAEKERLIDRAPDTEVFTTRAEKKNDKITAISESRFLTLLSTINDGSTRDLLLVGFYMGLRIGELLHCRYEWVVKGGTMLRIGDLRSWNLEAEFHPKSQKEYDHPIAIPAPVEKVFKRYSGGEAYSPIFGFNSGSSIRRALKSSFAGLPDPLNKTFSAHHLRHSCISYWLNEKRVPIQEVQRLARHSRMATTMKYYHPDDEAHIESFYR